MIYARIGLVDSDTAQQVIDYLNKKGYSRTEAMLRTEMANLDAEGRPMYNRQEENGGAKYGHSFGKLVRFTHKTELLLTTFVAMLKVWIDENLDIYKVRTLLDHKDNHLTICIAGAASYSLASLCLRLSEPHNRSISHGCS